MFKRKRDVEEGPQPSQACSYCGKDATPEYGGDGRIRGGPWQFLVQPLPTRWSRHDFLSYNGGVWWMRALGPGEWWRRCHWWSELHVAGEEKDWSILLQRCARCGVDETLMAEACSTMADDRAEWERAHPADEEAKVCGLCSFCGELIKASSTGLKPCEVGFLEFSGLTYCRGVWWMRAHGGDHWRRCHWWNVEDAAIQDGETLVELKRCHRCSKEYRFLDDTHAHMMLGRLGIENLGVSPLQDPGRRN